MLLLTPEKFPDYELLDCGDFEKLERFGECITIRPEPQAVWDKGLTNREWDSMAHVRFIPQSSSSGMWKKMREMPDRWNIEYEVGGQKTEGRKIKFRLALTSFKHVGIFPEQAVNWEYVYESLTRLTPLPPLQGERGSNTEDVPKVLNLFAYTGGASLAAKAAGADVVHLDSVKQVVTWARENMELSGLKDIRWVVEDAMTFVKREVKRGKKYHGIILDPPAYGHGTDGQKWKLEEMINEMLKMVFSLLDEKNYFLVFNSYSLGFSSLIVENLLKEKRGSATEGDTGELYLQSKTGIKLPLGVFGRVRK
ncbi:MAG TPA: class I SAM-dependent methyltransferase [Bacteroidia bacterium]|nr:class I SAM-dependent methyltransferase [Bacteroidia bacterium]